jgi:alkylation response protein AidB-like acyl-CoA dehydrogenase
MDITLTNGATVVDAARRLAPELSERAQENEERRTMAPDLVDKMRHAGLFHLGLPAALGGLECDPTTILDTIEEVSRADGSAGWTAFIGNATAFVAWLDPAVAKDIVADRPDFVAAPAFAPTGTGRVTGDNIAVEGRWQFVSGCPHADWVITGVTIMDGDSPRLAPSGRPDWRFAFYPARDARILDTWHVAGLRGTGSNDLTATGVQVPLERTCMPFYEPAQFEGPLYRLPFPTFLMTFIAGFPLGVARRALDEFTAIAARKSRSVPPGPTMAEDAAVQVELARAEAAVRSARAFIVESLGAAWATACAGDELSLVQRATTVLAILNAARTSRAVVDSVFGMAGAGALFDSSPLQRCARDLMAGTQHLMLGMSQWKAVGRVLSGLDPVSHML